MTKNWIYSLYVKNWLTAENNHILDQIRPSDSIAFHKPRLDRRGGGVAIICKPVLKPVQQDTDAFDSFEHIIVETQSKESRFTLVNLYRPPSSNLSQFFEEFASLLDIISFRKEPILVCGDFNIHTQNATDSSKRKLDDILTKHDLIQHVRDPTHTTGNTIDLIMTRSSDSIVHLADVGCFISDHSLVSAQLHINKPPTGPGTSTFRKIRDINIEKFKNDIRKLLNTTI